MRKNQTSMTAIGIAILRGIESEKPAGERLCTMYRTPTTNSCAQFTSPARMPAALRLRVCDRLGGG